MYVYRYVLIYSHRHVYLLVSQKEFLSVKSQNTKEFIDGRNRMLSESILDAINANLEDVYQDTYIYIGYMK